MKKNIFVFFKDVFLNTFAFCIYVFAQQVILMPYLAKHMLEKPYAVFLIYISILNIICNSFGSQLGVAKQVNVNKKSNDDSDYQFLILTLSFISIIICLIFGIIYSYSAFNILMLSIILIFCNFRFYVRYLFRINDDYKSIILQNVLYFIGIIIGLFVYSKVKYFWLPMLIGELFGFLLNIFKKPITVFSFKRSKKFKQIFSHFFGYSLSSFLSNITSLIDKLLVFPLLGSLNLIIYTVGNTFSKLLALISNPINDVVLAWISKKEFKITKGIIIKSLLLSILLILVLTLFSIPIIYTATLILYKQYLFKIKKIIVLLSISGSIVFITSFFKSFVIRYSKSLNLVYIYLVHIIFLSLFGYFGAKFFALNGFLIGVILSRAQLWISYSIVLYKSIKPDSIQSKGKLIVSLSFDDGRKDTYDYAYRILRKYDLNATVHVITGYVDHTWNPSYLASSYAPCSRSDLKEMSKHGIEISAHGDTHTTDYNDLKKCISKLEKWRLVNGNCGFAVPFSNEKGLIDSTFNKYCKDNIKYIRVGKNLEELSFIKKCEYLLYQITKIDIFYKLYNRININKFSNMNKMHLTSIGIKKNDKLSSIKKLITSNINKDNYIILMFHSIQPKENCYYNKDVWVWDEEKFDLLCKYLSQLKQSDKIEVKKIIDVVKEK